MCLPSTLIGCCAREVGKSISLASVLESGTVRKSFCQPKNWVRSIYKSGVFICKARDCIWEGGRLGSIHFTVSACHANLSPDNHHLSSCWGILGCLGKIAANTKFEENAYPALGDSTLVLHFI